jgi:transcription initiation factor TFIIA large subunit
MSNNTVSAIYSGVIKDVIANVRKDFEDSGVDESVLLELERIWENKIKSAKVAPWEANGITNDDSGQNVNGSASATLYQTSQSSPNDAMKFQSQYEKQAATLPSLAVPSIHTNHNDIAAGPYIVKNSKYTIQNSPASIGATISSDISNRSNSVTPINSQDALNVSNISSVDQKIYHNSQIMKDPNLGHLNEKLVPRSEVSTNSSPQPLPEFETRVEPSFTDVDNDDINSELDDSEDDEANADSEETQNIILCLYDKVTRTKNKWKCQLKDGIVSVNGRDYLFQKGNGDFEF